MLFCLIIVMLIKTTFKGSTKSFCLTNVKVSALLDNVLQRCSWGCKKTYIFIKKIIQCGDGWGIPEPVGDGDEIQFLIPVGYG